MRSVRIEPTRMILVGTMITYQATGYIGTRQYISPHVRVIVTARVENPMHSAEDIAGFGRSYG